MAPKQQEQQQSKKVKISHTTPEEKEMSRISTSEYREKRKIEVLDKNEEDIRRQNNLLEQLGGNPIQSVLFRPHQSGETKESYCKQRYNYQRQQTKVVTEAVLTRYRQIEAAGLTIIVVTTTTTSNDAESVNQVTLDLPVAMIQNQNVPVQMGHVGDELFAQSYFLDVDDVVPCIADTFNENVPPMMDSSFDDILNEDLSDLFAGLDDVMFDL